MSKKLYFDIFAKVSVIEKIDNIKLREKLWPAYIHNICITDNTDDSIYDVKVKARVMEGDHQICGACRAITYYELVPTGSLTDAIDFVMEDLLNQIDKTQDTWFTRGVSCIDKLTAINIPKNPTGRDIVDSLTYAFGRSQSHIKPWYKQYIDIPELKRVHSSGPVSVAIWSNGKKSMVRKQKGDKSDPEKGILYAVIKGLCYEKGGTKEYSRVLDMIHEALEERKNG